jgi:hypothetical protein
MHQHIDNTLMFIQCLSELITHPSIIRETNVDNYVQFRHRIYYSTQKQ